MIPTPTTAYADTVKLFNLTTTEIELIMLHLQYDPITLLLQW